MSGEAKAPPVFKEGMSYSNWKHQITAWEALTSLPAAKRGLSVYLHALEGTHMEVISKLPIAELQTETGVQKILALLDRYCEKKLSERQYDAYTKMHNFRRKDGETVSEALIKFESIVCDLESLEMKLPTAVLAFHVLHAMRIGESNENLARATVAELNYDNMVSQIRSIAEKGAPKSSEYTGEGFGEIKIESEDTACALYTRGYSRRSRGRRIRGGRNNYGHFTDRRCFSCGSPDHMSYDCTSKTFNSANSGNFSNNSGTVNSSQRKCFKCNSPDHYAYSCPNRATNNGPAKEVNIILLETNAVNSFLGETLGHAVVDCGAKSNVTGDIWLDNYIQSLSESEQKLVKEEEWITRYRFGDGQEVVSDVRVTVPVKIGGIKHMLSTSVIRKNLPLLWSFESLNKNSVKIDFGSLTLDLAGKLVPLKRTNSGHLVLPLKDHLSHDTHLVLHVRNLENLTDKEKERKMNKLHIQMAHASKESLIRLLHSSGITDKSMEKALIKVSDNCEFCLKHKRKPLRPCVSEPLSEGFNNTVAMDLKTVVKDKIYILHLICLGTKFSTACVIRNKFATTIIKGVLKIWIQLFGAPKRFITDNGNEFANLEFKTLCEQFNIVSVTTPGESPWSNGVIERHNGILMETVRRVMDDMHCDLETALPWSICAKNTLSNVNGYSPNILVFGQNPNEPSILHDKLPAMEPCTASELVKRNLELRIAARKAYIAADSSERIRRSLRMKLRTSNNTIVNNGDYVYYRRLDTAGWKGPGIVIGNDRKLVIVKHGGQIYRVPLCQVLPLSKANSMVNEQAASKDEKENEYKLKKKSDDAHSATENPPADLSIDENSENDENSQLNDIVQGENEIEQSDEDEQDNEKEDEQDDEIEMEQEDGYITSDVLPPINSTVQLKSKDNGLWQTANILSRGGSARGVNKMYMNIKVQGEDKPKGVFWDRYVDIWKSVENIENVVLFLNESDEFKQPVIKAKENELENWRRNKVYIKVKDTGQKTVSSRWVITEKQISGSTATKTKARIVCRGYEEDSSSFRTDSPTCTKESLRLAVTTIISSGWECKSLDVRAAFLQGFPIEREVYMKPPPDIKESGIVWKLLRCPYGLNDAPRSWFRRVRCELLRLGVTFSQYDEAFVYYKVGNRLAGVMVLHVDDFFFGGTKSFLVNVIQKLTSVFEVSIQNCVNFKYIGLELMQIRNCVVIDQSKYIENISCIELSCERNSSDLLTKEERESMRSLCGQLLWVSNNTRPDVAYEVSTLSNLGRNATVKDIWQINKLVKSMKQERMFVKYPNLGNYKKWKLMVFSDSSFANLPDGSSQGGYIVFLANEEGKVAPLSWQSKKLHKVTKSTLSSETLAAIEAVDAAILIQLQVKEIFDVVPDIILFTDSRSLHQTVHTSHVLNDKSLRVSVSYLRQFVNRKEIKVCWVESKNQIADSLTKFGASPYQLKGVFESCFL